MSERTYVVTFAQANEDDKKRFGFLYGWFIAGGNSVDRKGIEVVRREALVVDKFWAISDRLEGLPEGVEARRLKIGGGTLTFQQPEYELIKRYLESANPRTELSRQYVETVDWWSSLKPEVPA